MAKIKFVFFVMETIFEDTQTKKKNKQHISGSLKYHWQRKH